MNKRLQEFDVLRVIAALAVIAIHVTAGYIDKSSLAYLGNNFVRFAVPLFVILSGFLLCYTDGHIPVSSLVSFYRKRLGHILWPFLIWSFIYCLLNAYLLRWDNPVLVFTTWGKSLCEGTACYHLYFIPIILQFYLLYPWLQRWLFKNPRQFLIASLGITVMVQLITCLSRNHMVSLPHWIGAWYLLGFPVWLIYFALGMFTAYRFQTGLDGWASWLKRNPIGLAFIYIISLGTLILDSRWSQTQGSVFRLSVMIYAVSSYFFFFSLACRVKQKNRPWLKWLSKQSFLIYLMHPFLITILIKIAGHFGHPGLWDGNLGMAGLYCSTVLLSIACTLVASITPMVSLLGGVEIHKASQTIARNGKIM